MRWLTDEVQITPIGIAIQVATYFLSASKFEIWNSSKRKVCQRKLYAISECFKQEVNDRV